MIIKNIQEVVYKLDLPADSRIYPVFHVRRMKKKCLLDEDIVVDSTLELKFFYS